MPTNSPDRAETRTVAIAAPPEAVLGVVGDARRLPEWAPEFAHSVRPDGDGEGDCGDGDRGDGGGDGDGDGDGWIVDNGGAEFPIRLRVDAELGTVDILGRTDPPRGAFARVIPNGAGSEFLFTLAFPAGTDPAAIDAQMATVDRELEAVRALSEAAAARPPTSRY